MWQRMAACVLGCVCGEGGRGGGGTGRARCVPSARRAVRREPSLPDSGLGCRVRVGVEVSLIGLPSPPPLAGVRLLTRGDD
jgi:hypothetical protein